MFIFIYVFMTPKLRCLCIYDNAALKFMSNSFVSVAELCMWTCICLRLCVELCVVDSPTLMVILR